MDLFPCGACLEHFGVRPAVGEVRGMDDIVGVLAEADVSITL